jgi:hypothetical protein
MQRRASRASCASSARASIKVAIDPALCFVRERSLDDAPGRHSKHVSLAPAGPPDDCEDDASLFGHSPHPCACRTRRVAEGRSAELMLVLMWLGRRVGAMMTALTLTHMSKDRLLTRGPGTNQPTRAWRPDARRRRGELFTLAAVLVLGPCFTSLAALSIPPQEARTTLHQWHGMAWHSMARRRHGRGWKKN